MPGVERERHKGHSIAWNFERCPTPTEAFRCPHRVRCDSFFRAEGASDERPGDEVTRRMGVFTEVEFPRRPHVVLSRDQPISIGIKK